MIWACPLCKAALQETETGVACESNHRFDRARQGYLHLLPAHQKGSRAPGDDRKMLQQRREFLQEGFYEPLAKLLQEQWLRLIEGTDDSLSLLDSGCGEGYYLRQLQEVSEPYGDRVSLYGIDISKEAAKLASRELAGVDVAVASGFQLPVKDSSLDVLLRVFSPGDSEEVARVLKTNGEFWRVVPGENHLVELKRSLYREVKQHDLPETPKGFELVGQESLTFLMHLSTPNAVKQLLEMTPFVWRGSREGKERLQSATQLDVTAEFVLQKYCVLTVKD